MRDRGVRVILSVILIFKSSVYSSRLLILNHLDVFQEAGPMTKAVKELNVLFLFF